MRYARTPMLVAMILALTVAANAETIKFKDIEVTVRPGGCGIVDEVKFRGEVVMSTSAAGYERTKSPGERDRAKYTAKLLTLKANAPCKLTQFTSARGHKMVTLENGLLKVTAMSWFGGRIIRLESKLTGQNFLDNPYEDRPEEVKGPKDMGGMWGELSDGIFKLKIVKQADDEVAVLLTGTKDGLRVEKTLCIRRGSAALKVEQKVINTGDERRSGSNEFQARYRVGESTGGEDVLCGSSRGVAVVLPKRRSSPDCFTDPRIDKWAGIYDKKEHIAIVTAYDGPIVRIGSWIRPGFYQLEHRTPRHFDLAAGESNVTKMSIVPVFNTSGLTFANGEWVVGITPEVRDIPASAETLFATVTVIRTRVEGRRVPPMPVALKAALTDKHGKAVKTLPLVMVMPSSLIGNPQKVFWPVGDLPAGEYLMNISMEADGKVIGKTAILVRRRAAGPILEVFRPADSEKGKPYPVLGTVERAKVRVMLVRKTSPTKIRVTGEHVIAGVASPFEAVISLNRAGDGFDVRHTLVCNTKGASARIRAAGIAFPLVLGSNLNKIRTTVGGEKLNDSWRVDQTDESISTSTISDYFSRWPYWKLGGILQDTSNHYRIWKASDWDVAPMPTLEGKSAPGWVEVNNGKFGVRISMDDMPARAPRGIVVDGFTGEARVYFYPPQAPPIALVSSADRNAPTAADRLNWKRGKPWTNVVKVRFQAGAHAFGFKRELSDKAFRAGLEALGETTVTRSMARFALPRGTFEECIQTVLDTDISFRDYMRRAIGGGYRLRRLCQKLGVTLERDDIQKTVDGIVEKLKEEYP